MEAPRALTCVSKGQNFAESESELVSSDTCFRRHFHGALTLARHAYLVPEALAPGACAFAVLSLSFTGFMALNGS